QVYPYAVRLEDGVRAVRVGEDEVGAFRGQHQFVRPFGRDVAAAGDFEGDGGAFVVEEFEPPFFGPFFFFDPFFAGDGRAVAGASDFFAFRVPAHPADDRGLLFDRLFFEPGPGFPRAFRFQRARGLPMAAEVMRVPGRGFFEPGVVDAGEFEVRLAARDRDRDVGP